MAARVAARTAALVEGDVERMTEILAEDFTYTNASGESCDREGYLAAYVGSPDLVWLSQASSEPVVRTYGDTAVVTLDVHDRGHLAGRAVRGRVPVAVRLRPPRRGLALRRGPDHVPFLGHRLNHPPLGSVVGGSHHPTKGRSPP